MRNDFFINARCTAKFVFWVLLGREYIFFLKKIYNARCLWIVAWMFVKLFAPIIICIRNSNILTDIPFHRMYFWSNCVIPFFCHFIFPWKIWPEWIYFRAQLTLSNYSPYQTNLDKSDHSIWKQRLFDKMVVVLSSYRVTTFTCRYVPVWIIYFTFRAKIVWIWCF